MSSDVDRFKAGASHCADVFYKVTADGIDRPRKTIIQSVFKSTTDRCPPYATSDTHPNVQPGGIGGVSPHRDIVPVSTFYTPEWKQCDRGRPFTLTDTIHVQMSPQFKDRARRFVGNGHAKAPKPLKIKSPVVTPATVGSRGSEEPAAAN